MKFLKGYKTYLAAGFSMLAGVMAWVAGSEDQGLELFLIGAGFLGLRSALEEMMKK